MGTHPSRALGFSVGMPFAVDPFLVQDRLYFRDALELNQEIGLLSLIAFL